MIHFVNLQAKRAPKKVIIIVMEALTANQAGMKVILIKTFPTSSSNVNSYLKWKKFFEQIRRLGTSWTSGRNQS